MIFERCARSYHTSLQKKVQKLSCDTIFDCFEYIKVNASSVNIPDMKATVTSTSKKKAGQKTDAYILSLTGKVLKPVMTAKFGDHVKNLFPILCHSSEYYDLVQQRKITNEVSKEDGLYYQKLRILLK